jgi:hypothetical protein
MSQIFLDQNLVEPVMVELVVCRNNSINSFRLQLSLSNFFSVILANTGSLLSAPWLAKLAGKII